MASCDNSNPVSLESIRIAVVVGEASGDLLGEGLILQLQKIYPNACFEGIGGPRMLALGFQSFFSQDRLAVMGFIEPLARLPELLSIRAQLRKRFMETPPDVFIGIDSPDFNLDLELSLKQNGIPTVHYVSPSVWAWRQGRIKKIAKAVDLMLTLLPFEADFYIEHNVPVKFVGHPLADQIPLTPNQTLAIKKLELGAFTDSKKIVALLPGSRSGEVQRLCELFLQVAQYCLSKQKGLVFLIPSANDKRYQQIQALVDKFPEKLPLRVLEGQSHLVMEAADLVIMASGTSTLEAMLYKRPMVIAYKVAALSYWLFSKLVKVKYIGLPNLLANRSLVPEFIQHAATVNDIGDAALGYLKDDSKAHSLKNSFTIQHMQLKQNASEQAARAISDLILAQRVKQK